MRQINRQEDVMTTHDDTVSPYLRRRLRSYEEAVRQHGNPTRSGERPQATRSATLDAAGLRETAASWSDR